LHVISVCLFLNIQGSERPRVDIVMRKLGPGQSPWWRARGGVPRKWTGFSWSQRVFAEFL